MDLSDSPNIMVIMLEATYASCRKVRPRVYWVSFAALLSGKYLVALPCVRWGDAKRSKLAYGKTISTVGPPVKAFPSWKVMLGLLAVRL